MRPRDRARTRARIRTHESAAGAVPVPRGPLVLALDLFLVAVALLDTWINVSFDERFAMACALTASLALLLRRRVPLLVYAVAVPAVLVTDAVMAALIALYTLASLTRSRLLLLFCGAAFTVCYTVPWPSPRFSDLSGTHGLISVGYSLATAAAPLFLGQLVQARRDLSLRLTEITEARRHERRLTAQTVLAKERAQLAREMHDVVAHQVSLIAVRAGALQVSTRDLESKEAASTIRRLSVQTLDELRHMVSVLRAPGSLPTELTPQPTLAGLDDLIAGSGIDTEADIDLSGELPPPVQRTIYRTVQEALTNVRKHAPGSTAAIRIRRMSGSVRVTVTNTAPTRPVLALPSGHHGLVGLRQRAELLGGTLEAGPAPDEGYLLRLDLPVDKQS